MDEKPKTWKQWCEDNGFSGPVSDAELAGAKPVLMRLLAMSYTCSGADSVDAIGEFCELAGVDLRALSDAWHTLDLED